MSTIKLNIDYLKTVNYVLFHNKIPICQSLDITNTTKKTLHNVRVIADGEYFNSTESETLPRINAGDTFRLSQFDIAPSVEKLTELTERVLTKFRITVIADGETAFEASYDIELMPYNYWLGTTIMPQTIASFITPNHPKIGELVVKTAEMMKQITGNSTLPEYQWGDIQSVLAQVAAAFAAIHQQGIIYRGMVASYEEIGQRIALPDQVLESKTGNCIELSLLLASVLEAIGINTAIVLQKGHAYLAAWLVNDCYPCSVCDDVSFLEKAISKGIYDLVVVECTTMTAEKANFNEAVETAKQNLANTDVFEMFVDVRRCRLEHIYPLPTRVERDGKVTFDTEGVEHDCFFVNLKEHDRYDLSRLGDGEKELTKFDIWERKLLDFTLRNSLLNLSMRSNAVQLISFDVDRIEDHLQDGAEYNITAMPNIEFTIDESERLVRSKLNNELYDFIRNDIDHQCLHTYINEYDTEEVLKALHKNSKALLENTGANSLFLAIGVLRWFETEESTTPRYAPILLLPVDIVRKRKQYFIRTRDEEIMFNITLREFLSQNYDIKFENLDTLPKDKSGVDVPLIFATIRDALKLQKRWDVEDECVLGTFSFTKFLLWNDIHNHRPELMESAVIESFVNNQLSWTPEPLTDNLKEHDKLVSPADLALPVPVDSSQMAAVIESGKGSSFILYGPPGTGKSQTITNLIANALYHGKRVLFVAEKMAALSVVQSRLEKIGIGAFCLELHSNKSTKRHVLQQLEKALNIAQEMSPEAYARVAESLFEERKGLIEYMEALHNVDAVDGLSLYDCILHYEAIDAEPLCGFVCPDALNLLLATEGVEAVEQMFGSHFDTVIKLVGQPSKHPLNGLQLEQSMLADTATLTGNMLADKEYIEEMMRTTGELKEAKAMREALLRDNSEGVFSLNPDILHQEWREIKAQWFGARFFAKRKFMERLREYNRFITEEEVDTLINSLHAYSKMHEKIERLHTILRMRFGVNLGDDEVPANNQLSSYAEKLGTWAANTSLMRDWLHWCNYRNELEKRGMTCAATAIENGVYEPTELCKAFMKALFHHKIEQRINQNATLTTFEGMLFDEKVATYKRLTEEFQQLTQKELIARLAARVPRIVKAAGKVIAKAEEKGIDKTLAKMADKVADTLDENNEIGLLLRNISNGGRGLALRDLFDMLPLIMPRLCPCMLMSPMSVAQFLDLSGERFDLVVFDEASQMPTSEAVGAIARGKSLVVVGDPKQMPPTSFFTTTNVDEEDAAIDDMESILEDCQALGMPALQLSWHYRSRHESLIAFSNNEYYDGSLVTFPSADDQQTKVHHVPVEGFYDKGGRRQNKAEAEAIVKEIERRLRDEELHKKSIGVISFSVVQQGLIEDMLQSLLDNDKELHDAAESVYEPIFVKNLENVQGDERDVILFSIGYGPDRSGKVSMNFGPLNNVGGERRLNVAVSRAREEMYIYSTLRAADIDLRRSKARGVEGLKHFLTFAETQSLPLTITKQTAKQDNLIAQQIANALIEKGYVAKTNVGRSQFKVDVAVGDANNNGVYKLAILLDGEGYRDTLTTRDREIVQPSVLKGLNWQVMRVWSIDWYNNKERVLNRIIEQLNSKTGTANG